MHEKKAKVFCINSYTRNAGEAKISSLKKKNFDHKIFTIDGAEENSPPS